MTQRRFRLTRRGFLKALGVAALIPVALRNTAESATQKGVWLNDVHSQLNATRVAEVVYPAFVEELQAVVLRARRENRVISIAGGRHAMGGQQFATHAIHVDTQCLNRILAFDAEAGTVKVEAGIQWPQLMRELPKWQGNDPYWGIRQKPTGTDDISIGGSMASNVHGRGLHCKPFIEDVESFELVNAAGEILNCSRFENPGLFKRVIGGYGLFGLVYSATLKLVPRQKIRRYIQMLGVEAVVPTIEQATHTGAQYGDYQFEIDPNSSGYLTRGILSVYRPVSPDTLMDSEQQALSNADWKELVQLAHRDKRAAFEKYARHYLKTHGQVYWSDTHQVGPYRDNYHELLDWSHREPDQATEMITEIYVPRRVLASFLRTVARDFRRHRVNLIYGTVRFIEKDDESFLPWATNRYASIVFNLHTPHTPEGLHRSADAFRRLIDRAIGFGGNFYLTYHRWATREQMMACYPKFTEFLGDKLTYDPEERFQSNWYRHYKAMFARA